MAGLLYFLFVYTLGGLTLLPLLVGLILLHAHLTLPQLDPRRLAEEASDGLRDAADEDTYIRSGRAAALAAGLDEKFRGKHDADLAEGYFAVCREYVPGGVDGKPPARTTTSSGGDVVDVPEHSPSVYQSMYRSLFDRKRQQGSSLDGVKNGSSNGGSAGNGANGNGGVGGNGGSGGGSGGGGGIGRFTTTKKQRNVFYVVLRHGHLMLYDDEHQVEVKHVISLAHHHIDLYAGAGETVIPEGELWIKRNAIRLSRKLSTSSQPADPGATSKPFFFFSDNCSHKEDFYHAMLQNQDKTAGDPETPPRTLHFDNENMVTLIQRLHSSEEQFNTRWLNALIGRFFLGIYKTQFIEDLIRMKITKKIARVKKPDFLTGIILRSINTGRAAPLITNPKLRDLTIDGDCAVEADILYEGHVRAEIAATIRIDLGSRFKAREVELVLAVTLKKLEGRGIVRFKPPPSNRLWISFETMPKMELSIEPIWGSRQITYGLVLRQIESRIREVFAETLVLPYWDDIPFYDTEKLRCRGGIWAEDGQGSQPTHDIHVPDEAAKDDADAETVSLDQPSSTAAMTAASLAAGNTTSAYGTGPTNERSISTPNLLNIAPKGLFSRKGHKATPSSDTASIASSSSVEKPRVELPKTLRSTSSTAVSTVSTSNADTVGFKHESKNSKDATSLMREISNRSQPSSPIQHAVAVHSARERSKSPRSNKRPSMSSTKSAVSVLSIDRSLDLNASQATITDHPREPSPSPSIKTQSSIRSDASAQSRASMKLAKLAESLTPSEAHQAQLAAISAAAANASRSWTWGSGKKGKHSNSPSISSASTFFSHSPSGSTPSGTGTTTPVTSISSSGEPYGRGRPLPPPGQPLPPPERANTFAGAATSWMGSMKRKSVSNVHVSSPLMDRKPSFPERKDSVSSTGTSGSEVKRRPVPPPPLPVRRTSRAGIYHEQHGSSTGGNNAQDDIVVVSAPQGVSGDEDEDEHDRLEHGLDTSGYAEGDGVHGIINDAGEVDLLDMDDEELDAAVQNQFLGDPDLSAEGDLATPLADGRHLATSSPMPLDRSSPESTVLDSEPESMHNPTSSRMHSISRKPIGTIHRKPSTETEGDNKREEDKHVSETELGREELTASELMARESISPADLLEAGPV